MATALAWKRINYSGIYRHVILKYTYTANGDITVQTGLRQIFSYSVSRPSVANGAVTLGTVSGGVITITTGNPAGACYIFVDAWGI